MTTVVVLALTLIAASPSSGPSAEDLASYDAAKASVGRDAEANVKLALWCEARGLQAERLKHLARAVLTDPTNTAARGLLGLVEYRGQWKRPEAVADKVKSDEALTASLAEYNARRAKAPEKAEAQYALALWCARNGLEAEARAHFTAVTRLDPTRDLAWKHLGYKKVNGRWTTDAILATEKAEAEDRKSARAHWKPLLTTWRGWLDDKNQKDAAEDALAGVTDPRAVASVCEVFGKGEATDQIKGVEILGQIDSPESTSALALLATTKGRSGEVRRAAILTLRRRDPREYVGLLLAMVRDPFRIESGVVVGDDGFYHRAIRVESKKDVKEVTFTTPIGRPGAPLGYPFFPADLLNNAPPAALPIFNPGAYAVPGFTGLPVNAMHPAHGQNQGQPVAMPAAQVQAMQQMVMNQAYSMTLALERFRAMRIEEELSKPAMDSPAYQKIVPGLMRDSELIPVTNSLIFAALNQSTEQNLPEDPEPWKKWWYDVQGYSYTPPKSTQGPKPTYTLSFPSCFAAGTPVKTIDGLRPIESLHVGDKVLAQNTRTGALSFRAVTAVHHNPPGKTLRLRIGAEEIKPSVFHRFWKAGRGWVMARDLKPGDVIRALGGRADLVAVESEGEEPVFNLDVSEDHSFFVGSGAVLVHDNSLPETRLIPFDGTPEVASATGQRSRPEAR